MILPKKGNDYLTVETSEILNEIGIEEINESLLSLPGADRLSGEDWKEISELIALGCDGFLARDLQEFYDIQTEKSYGDGRAYLDLVARCRGTIEPFKAIKDELVVVDWKTTNSPVDNENWRTRCIRSYQWREYKFREPSAKLFIFRGLSRSVDWRKKGEETEPAKRVREVVLHLPDSLIEDVSYRINLIDSMRASLADKEVWTKNTQSCDDYGYTCPYLRDCESNSMPRKLIELREMSFSQRETCLQCPERYRRNEIAKREGELNAEDSTNIGKVVHAGLQRIWDAAFQKFHGSIQGN